MTVRRHPRLDLHWVLAALPVLSIVPLVAFAAVLLFGMWQQEQEQLPRTLQQMARSLAVSVSRELNASKRQLERIAEAPSLAVEEPREAFHGYMKALSDERREWDNLILSDGTRQLLNAALRVGDPLPGLDAIGYGAVLRQGSAGVSDIYTSTLDHDLAVSVMVPVLRQGLFTHVLSARLSRQHLANLLQEPLGDFDVTSSVVDGSGRVVSRNRDFDQFFGLPATPSHLANIRSAPQGFARSKTLDGRTVLTAWQRMDNGWTVGVGVDPAPHEVQLRASILRVAAMGAGLLALSLAAALWLSRGIAGAIHRAAQGADAMAGERPVEDGRSEIIQIDRLLQAHQEASAKLQTLGAERNQALEELREELRRRDDFLSMLAHELRNPLAPMVNVLRLLDRSPGMGPKEQQALAILARQTRQLTRLVDDLLDASRLVTGKISIQPRAVSLTALVGEAAEAMGPLAGERRQRIEVQAPADAVEAMVDPERVSQVLQNLLGNAIKFGPEGGTLRIKLVSGDGSARVSVSDDGIGIDPARRGEIFKPFSQIDPGIDRSKGGLGLGLSTSLHLAAMHGGTLSVHSAGLGHGSVFTLTLPLRVEPAPPPACGPVDAAG